jgi:hypothetical protein
MEPLITILANLSMIMNADQCFLSLLEITPEYFPFANAEHGRNLAFGSWAVMEAMLCLGGSFYWLFVMEG